MNDICVNDKTGDPWRGPSSGFYITIEDTRYELIVPFEITMGFGITTFTADGMKEVTDKCDHCGRFNLREIELHTTEELLAHGWIRPVS